MATIFLSYSRKDTDVMLQVKEYLEKEGISVWTDDGLNPGTPDWQKAIEQEIDRCKGVVVLLSPSSCNSIWVRREINRANRLGRLIFPFVISDDSDLSVPLLLETSQRIDASESIFTGLSVLINEIKRHNWLMHLGVDDIDNDYLLLVLAGDKVEQFNYLQRLIVREPKEWAIKEMAMVARNLGKFEIEAAAWIKLNNIFDGANAYQRAALQAEQLDPQNVQGIALLYEKAKNLYDKMGLDDEVENCNTKIIQYRQLPRVIINAQAQKGFREGEFNLLRIEAENIGNGLASSLNLEIGGGRFEVDDIASGLFAKRIFPRRTYQRSIAIRPLENQVGNAVPLVIQWSWQDRENNNYRDRMIIHVQVRSREAPIDGTPQIIHYSYEPLVESLSQKGDIVEITKDKQLSQPRQIENTIECPTCHILVPNAKLCEMCGNPLGST